jgi:preprotein translocase subunit SecA
VSKAIKSAQTQVEQQNFEIRKNVLKYDEVMNKQRTVIYEERKRVLDGEDLHLQVQNMITDVITAYVDGATAQGYAEDWDTDTLWTALKTLYPISVTPDSIATEHGDLTRTSLKDAVLADARKVWATREETLTPAITRELERRVVLSVLDRKWREHLYEMDYLKEGIGLRAMAQRDPLVEYQREGFDMFAAMLDSLKEESVGFLYNLQVQVVPAGEPAPGAAAPGAPVVTAASAAATAVSNGGANGGTPAAGITAGAAAAAPAPVRRRVRPVEALPTQQAAAAASVTTAPGPAALRGKGLGGPVAAPPLTYSGPTEDGGTESRSSGSGAAGSRQGAATATSSKEPGRNAPCPCGSGKKYKLCHGRPGAN